jgi:hypothetical protein
MLKQNTPFSEKDRYLATNTILQNTVLAITSSLLLYNIVASIQNGKSREKLELFLLVLSLSFDIISNVVSVLTVILFAGAFETGTHRGFYEKIVHPFYNTYTVLATLTWILAIIFYLLFLASAVFTQSFLVCILVITCLVVILFTLGSVIIYYKNRSSTAFCKWIS